MPKYFVFSVALLWSGIVMYFCLENSSDVPKVEIPNIDKLAHIFFHFVFTFVWFLFFRKQLQINSVFKPLLYSFLFSFVFGIVIEIMQELFTTTRHADVLDVMANLTGATLSVLAVRICNRMNILNSILKN